MKFLVVAAFEPELTKFRELAKPANVAGLAIEAIGVGLVEAAIGMTRCISRHRPTHALLLGTCGAFSGLAIGDVVTVTRARLLDIATLDAHAETPPPMRVTHDLDRPLHDALVAAGARSVMLANTVGITTDDVLASRIASVLGPSPILGVEHLEAFAVARACATENVACNVALGVANVVGSRGREEWRVHHAEASARAAKLALEAIVRTTTRAQ